METSNSLESGTRSACVATVSPVNVHTEWDPLEEVIVGVLDGACVPEWHICLEATMPDVQHEFFRVQGGKPFPAEQIKAGQRDLAMFVEILEGEGVTVRRPEPRDFSQAFASPDWCVKGGLYAAMPRDVLLIIGNEIIESPMSWRSRHYEIHAYRSLIKEYFKRGARWAAAPRPELCDALYNHNYLAGHNTSDREYVITEFEPTFDAADFIKMGRDIFCQRSHVTNQLGIDWLRQHLGDQYRIHVLEVHDPHPMHIDATFMPMAPGKVLINEERLRILPDSLKNWDILVAPTPCLSLSHTLYMTSSWISMNVLMLDEERVVVEKDELSLIKALREWGFKPIPCPFKNFNSFGGSFHCATVDVRRRGALQAYL